MNEGGISKMYWSVSDTAEYGGYTRGPRLINEQTREEMRRILGEIQDGSFARELIEEFDARAIHLPMKRSRLHPGSPPRAGDADGTAVGWP